MALTAIIIGAVGAVTAGAASVVSGVQQQQAAKRAARSRQEQARQRQLVERRQRGRLLAAAEAASGAVGVGGGSPLEVEIGTIFESLESERLIRLGGDVEAAQLRREGRAAFTAGILGGTGTILTGLGRAGSQFEALEKD